MRYDRTMREEALKNKVAEDFFPKFDCTNILGNVDFSVCVRDDTPTLFDNEFLVWGEAKRGVVADFKTSFAQLILTIGKEKTFDRYLPPQWLCEFDSAQIAFVPYSEILAVFYENDFNWNVTPSDHGTREFRALYDRVRGILEGGSYVFSFDEDERLLRDFIKANLKVGKRDVSKRRITKNNFISIYNRWLTEVKPSIAVNWEALKRKGILDSDFYLADIMSKDNAPIMQKLHVLLVQTKYVLDQHIDESGLFSSKTATFNDEGVAHARFWIKYERPPKKEYQDEIIERKELLVPQDVRERKGSYFTPAQWVDLSQQYIERILGENWQDEYYVWDCAAGTGNLLVGLKDKYRIFASTIDKTDVDVMHERIRNGANLLDSHVFQFDFLNDTFDKLPNRLLEIIRNPNTRQKLVVYINPPWGEGDNRIGTGRSGIAETRIQKQYADFMGYARREMFIQFHTRIYKEIPSCIIANFSTLKNLQAPKFYVFRNNFTPRLKCIFVAPANSFDNVDGDFPASFSVWDTKENERFKNVTADVYDAKGIFIDTKEIVCYDGMKLINDWCQSFIDEAGESIATAIGVGNDFQNQRTVRFEKPHRQWNHQFQFQVTSRNLLLSAVYVAVRNVVKAGWLNDRDQFLCPLETVSSDGEFQLDCLVWALFSSRNKIRSFEGPNHWIPFTEEEVGARDAFTSHFMSTFLKRITSEGNVTPPADIFSGTNQTGPINLSAEANEVMCAGLGVWRYYHEIDGSNPDVSFYDIQERFQGRNDSGRLNPSSSDGRYSKLTERLKKAVRLLEDRILSKAYEHGFLIR